MVRSVSRFCFCFLPMYLSAHTEVTKLGVRSGPTMNSWRSRRWVSEKGPFTSHCDGSFSTSVTVKKLTAMIDKQLVFWLQEANMASKNDKPALLLRCGKNRRSKSFIIQSSLKASQYFSNRIFKRHHRVLCETKAQQISCLHVGFYFSL